MSFAPTFTLTAPRAEITYNASNARANWNTCKHVSDVCPVSATVLSYYPNLGVNIFLAIGFGFCVFSNLGLGLWKKTYGYTLAITAGCMLEVAGYIGRVLIHYNPWNNQAFETQICAIILAPTLMCISIYLTIKHIALSINPAISRFEPRLFPFIFIPSDVSCLCIQAIGGGMAAGAGYTNKKLLDAGNRMIIAGIALQVVVLAAFGLVCTDYFIRVKRWQRTEEGRGAESMVLWRDGKFRLFLRAVGVAYAGILIRCIYRIAEMAGGWGNKIMQDEPSFIVLEGFMILIPALILSTFQPGLLFRDMAEREKVLFDLKCHKKSAAADEGEKSGEAPVIPTTTDASRDGKQSQTESKAEV